MNKEELIGKLQMVYVVDKNALNELIGYYDGLKQGIEELQQENKKYKEVIYKLKEWVNTVQQNKDNKHLEPFISTDELDELLDILKEVSE